jgi:hypothetical protein
MNVGEHGHNQFDYRMIISFFIVFYKYYDHIYWEKLSTHVRLPNTIVVKCIEFLIILPISYTMQFIVTKREIRACVLRDTTKWIVQQDIRYYIIY